MPIGPVSCGYAKISPFGPVTCDHVQSTNFDWFAAAPYGRRSTRLSVMEKVGMYWYSICATSGAPLPALSAVRSFVYWSAPWPALTTLILMAGYFCWKSATSWAMLGTQVQKVSVVGVVMALSMSAWPTGWSVAAFGVDEEPEQPVTPRTAASAAAVPANRRRRLRYLLEVGMGGSLLLAY